MSVELLDEKDRRWCGV